MTKIIGISGRKQSGKNTVGNIVNGIVLKNLNMIQDYAINEEGNLQIKTATASGDIGWGIFDILRRDEEFISYAESNLWPYIKAYHFADYLKKMSIDLFDLTPDQVYGSDTDKNTSTPYSQNGWKHKMTSREFLQYLGTDVMRKIKDTVWVDYTIKTIKAEGSSVAIIPDVRFPNEVESIKKAGGVVLRLTRDPFHSDHSCESALDEDNYDWNNFDEIIDNKNLKILELVQKIETFKWMWS